MKSLSELLFSRTASEATLPDTEKGLEIVEVSTEQILANPFQPRKTFTEEGLAELTASIREYGIIQPLVLRKNESGYEIIAGERRFRAAKRVGLLTVPSIIRQATDKEMAEIALIENLQREDLHYFEEASGYEKLLTQFGLTQDVLAKSVGKDQSTIANKLRLLKLAPEVREFIFQANLTERHSRALLKIEEVTSQLDVLHTVIEHKLNVRDTEMLIEERLQAQNPAQNSPKRHIMLKVVKDVRIFINTVGELVKQMKKAGLDVRLTQTQDDDTVTLTMVVPKRR
jgi:ParB family transcriptional regulator, chromosome partitioning protein